MSIRVRIEHGQGAGTTWRLTGPGVYRLGRSKDCSIQVLDMKVSKHHCEIHVGNNGTSALLHDLGSTHGAMINGQPQAGDTPLKAGDELRLGLSILRVLSDGPADHDIAPIAGRSADDSVDTSGATPAATTLHSLPPDQLVGKDLGGYQIEGKIGAGGMGGVYLAEQTSLRRKVALKVLNERFGSDSAFIDQFINEARAAGALNHPNVVQVYDVGSADGHYYFSMEVMPGGSIEDRIKSGPADWREALNWFLDAANALIFAHKKQILHRDVKPDNLMLAEDGSAKLCDLGLAKKAENDDLMAQGIIGTPHFISPEAIRRRADIDHRTDLYSLGCSFYRILTGRNPYPGKTVKEILLGHLNKPVPRVRDRVEDIPRDLDEVVYKLMAKDPAERFQVPEGLLQALDKVRLRHGLEAHGIRPHSRKTMFIALAAAAIVAIGAVAWVLTREDKVIVESLTEEELAERKQTEIDKVRYMVEQEKLQPERKFLDWANTARDQKLKASTDEWKSPFWQDTFLPEIRDSATAWSGTAEDWTTQSKDQKHEEARGLLTDGADFMRSQATKATEYAGETARYLNDRRKNEVAIRTARAKADEELTEQLSSYATRANTALEEGRYLEAAKLMTTQAIEKTFDPFRKRTEKAVLLLQPEDVDERLKKTFGVPAKDGPFKGQYWAKKFEAARTKVIKTHADVMSKIKAVDPETPVFELHQHIANLAAHIATLPANPDPAAGTLARLYSVQRDGAKIAMDQLNKQVTKRIRADYDADTDTYISYVKRVFAPTTSVARGNLRRLEFVDAGVESKNLANAAKTKEFRRAAKFWGRAISGLNAAFQRAVSSFPDGWSDTKYTYVDDRGKTKSKPIKDVTADGFKLGRRNSTFTEWTATWHFNNLFRSEGKPRFALQGDEVLGMALLAELAGDYDVARSSYEAMLKTDGLDGETKTSIQWRLQALEREATAARLWVKAAEILEHVETFLVEHRTKDLSEDEVAKLAPKVLDESKSLRAKLQEAMAVRSRLEDDAALAGTLLGIALRDGAAHPDATYVGEVKPDVNGAPKNGPPKKNGG